ncbi:hypothetical protein AX15_000250 [Amanita polypyramis BW_CC]|nr:hypothetical protein AX15_000250 [Amanita polypyramis BW_CC]
MTLTNFHALPISILQLSLAAVLKCGQSFRWSITPLSSEALPTHEYRLCLRDRVVCLRQTSDTLYYRAVYPDPQPTQAQLVTREKETVEWLRDYFQLDVNLQELYSEWASRDLNFARLQHRFSGIRVLRQDPWECLVSFICSSNNNISRITKMVNSLCNEFSRTLFSLELPLPSSTDERQAHHPFPPPSVLAGPEVVSKLRSLGFGYRASFIQKTARMLVEAHGSDSKTDDDPREPGEVWLEKLRGTSTEEARDELLKFTGVGRKVADCVLLMSLDKKEVVPIDTHVYQLAIKYYGLKGSAKGKPAMSPKIYDEVSAKLYSIWGEHAGWAHSVMFTSDLKSFSTYGLPAVPSTSLSTSVNKMVNGEDEPPTKRKRSRSTVSEVPIPIPNVPPPHPLDLIDTIKKRRRVMRIKA